MKKYFKKWMAGLMLSVMMIGTLASCGATSSSSGSAGSQAVSGSKILFVSTDREDAYRELLTQGIIDSATEAGVTLDLELCGNDAEAQVKMVASAEANGYDAVIVRLADSSTAPQVNLAAGNLPVVYVNNSPDTSALKADKYMFVASDENQAGKYQVEYVLSKLGTKDLNIIIMEGQKGHSGATQRTQAVKDTLKDNGINYNIVFMDYANWSDTEAEAKLELFFKTKQSVDVIFCNNDTMALGAVKALKKAGLSPSNVPVTGVDATADGCASIKAGDMAFTVFQNANGQAAKAIEIASILGSGKSVSGIDGVTEDGTCAWVPFEAVDASNVDQYM